MDENFENPFDIMSLASGEGLFGRGNELDWLMKGIQEQARLLLFGGEGMGKSSLLEQAGTTLAQRNEGWMIRVDLSLHQSMEEVAGVFRKATNQLQRSPDQAVQRGVLGDGGKRPSQGQDPTAGSSSGTKGVTRPGDLLGTLGELNAFALQRRRSVVVALDSCHEMGRLGGGHLESILMEAVESHSATGYILSGDERGLKTQSAAGLQMLQNAFQTQQLGPLEPQGFAQWIDRQFQLASIVSRGVGTACVGLAGPNTGQAVELAQRAFALSFQARFANEATVQTALGQVVAGKNDRFAHLWAGLSANEQNVMRGIAKTGGQGLLGPDAFRRCGLQSDEQTRSAIDSLVDKRVLDPAGPAGEFKMQSAALKQWTLQARMSFGRDHKPDGTSGQQLSFSLNFKRSVTPSKARSNSP